MIALDVGGTQIKGGLLGGDGTVLHTERWLTRAGHGPNALIDRILGCADELVALAERADRPPAAAGIVVPGIVDETSGLAVYAANLGWRDVPLPQWLAEHLDLPVAFGHDVRTGGLAEARLGAGRGCADFLFVPVGTGIAAAVVADGRPLTGAHGAAGELGHLVVRPGGEPCRCGGHGCLETVASASAIARRYTRATGEREVTAKEVGHRAAAGEAAATRIWGEAVEALADGLTATVTLINPERIVIGGGLAKAGEALLTPLRAALAARLSFQRPPELVPAELGHEAGCRGAALLAQDLLDSRSLPHSSVQYSLSLAQGGRR
ncbi:ROK family protein [Kitasatospora sp. Root107]|nr:ROK family protein [Kitasatospora sp. Root107]KQV12410.1 ROK family transcriptional regulator [Kitasatospora sp. Root107]